MWRPSAPLDNLRRRAMLLAEIRQFFAKREVLEVETPVISRAALTDPQIDSLETRYIGPGAAHGLNCYLHTSPEFPMKRLLAAGSGPIYQLAKVFRQGEAGRRHNPEFTMLEWYRPGWNYRQLMDEVERLVSELLQPYLSLKDAERITYQQAFMAHLDIDPYTATVADLKACAEGCGIHAPMGEGEDERDDWLNLLLSHQIEPKLGRERLTFLCDYPPSQAALARVREGEHAVAERFELYLNGIELANGFNELADADEQRRRFEAENAQRKAHGKRSYPIDEGLLSALDAGFPECSGVALGVDRLVMLACGATSIDQVISFSIERA